MSEFLKTEDTSGTSEQDKILFVTFCVEMYARRHCISGAEAMHILDSADVCEFLVECYDPLHSLDREAILDEIEIFMKGNREHANN